MGKVFLIKGISVMAKKAEEISTLANKLARLTEIDKEIEALEDEKSDILDSAQKEIGPIAESLGYRLPSDNTISEDKVCDWFRGFLADGPKTEVEIRGGYATKFGAGRRIRKIDNWAEKVPFTWENGIATKK